MQFHAAVGLAELGNVEGLRCLIESDSRGDMAWQAVSHWKDPSTDLLQSRIHALADLTGQSFKTIEEAQDWWAANKPTAEEFKPKSRVLLRYP